MFKAFLIPSSITFLLISELIALSPMFKSFVNASNVSKFLPRLKTYPNNPARFCVLRFLYRLVPIVRFFLVVTFGNKFFQLTLSYLATKECPLGNVTRLGVTFCLNNTLSLYISHTLPSCFTSK